MAPRDKAMRDMPPPEPHTQGGGQRGGPRRWTGTGPRPARHIPWPEIFKHHQSVITGHLKMLDMIRKHTVEGSGNYRTILPMVDRCKEMLRQFREITSTFIPPKDNFDTVPLGSSSASMYPGYSPADHIYGEASQEYGSEWSRAKKEGKEPKLDPTRGPEYVVGSSRIGKRKQLEEVQKGLSTDDGQPTSSRAESSTKESNASIPPAKPSEPIADTGNPYFVVDTQPTPVNIPDHTTATAETSHKSKKSKTKHEDPKTATPIIETEDISAEVEARMKSKEGKRDKKDKKDSIKEKKRKRETDDSTTLADTETATAEPVVAHASTTAEKPKKKKAKKGEEVAEVAADTNGASASVEKKSKKDKKERKREAADVVAEESAVNGDADADGGKKKKRKKNSAES